MTTAAPVDIPALAGPGLLGYLLNWGLYGALVVQVFFYYLSFPKDPRGIKCLVSFVFLMETVQTAVMTSDCFNAYANGFGGPEILNDIQNEWLVVPVFTAIVSCVVELFYAYRLHILSKSMYLPACICLLSLVQFSGGILAGVRSLQVDDFSGLESQNHISHALWLGCSLLCDIFIATSMVYTLLRTGEITRSTQLLVNRIARLIIETGTLTAIVTLLAFVLYYAFPSRPYYVVPAVIIAKCYSNSLLAIFNSRIRVIGGRESQETDVHFSFGNVQRTTDATGPRSPSSMAVQIREDVYVHTDALQLDDLPDQDPCQVKKSLGLSSDV